MVALQETINKIGKLTGLDKAAIFLLSVSADKSSELLKQLDDDEIILLTQHIAQMGRVDADVVEAVFKEFIEQVGGGGLLDSLSSTEKLLLNIFDEDKVSEIMANIKGPSGRNVWEKIGKANPEIIANYLVGEHPQTTAVILSKLKSAQAAKVMSLLPQEVVMEVINRMIGMEAVSRDVIRTIENNLRNDFMTNFINMSDTNTVKSVAEIFNSFDRATNENIMGKLENKDADTAEKIKALMFMFTDMVKLNPAGIQTVIRVADKDKLAMALKGAPDNIKEMFFSNMSERATKMMKEEIASMGAVKLKDVDEAQGAVVAVTKDCIDKGEIEVASGDEEPLVE